MHKEKGKCSWFGGEHDTGMARMEAVALWSDREVYTDAPPGLFKDQERSYPLGMGRRLNTRMRYCAMRWNYIKHPKEWLRRQKILIAANGIIVDAIPVDWGPAEDTGRIIDVSPEVMRLLKIDTDDVVTVRIPDVADSAIESGWLLPVR